MDKLKQRAALRIHGHTVVFADESMDARVLQYGMMGWTTEAIARKCNVSGSQVLYRLKKAGLYRKEIRSGVGPIARQLAKITLPVTRQIVRTTIAPKFARLAIR